MTQLKSIHTLDARGHIFLEVVKDYFSLTSAQMHVQIRLLRDELEQNLKKKGIEYEALKGALVPDPHRKEIAFVFDTYELQDETWYGLPIFRQLMPLIEKKSSHSFLMGDFIGSNSQQDRLFERFCEVFVPAREFVWRHSGLLYIVYINNLTDSMVINIHNALASYKPYAGFADCTYHSKFKQHIGLSISNVFLKHKNVIIQGNPDDEFDKEDYNVSGYPFEEFGYKVRSVSDISFGALLSYKIEMPVHEGFISDEEMSLNAITPAPALLGDFEVSVAEAKAEYIRNAKSNSMDRAGLKESSAPDLAKLIKSKISNNYIYSMRVNEYGDKLFNVIIETSTDDGVRTRLLCGLKYLADEKKLSLVTMF